MDQHCSSMGNRRGQELPHKEAAKNACGCCENCCSSFSRCRAQRPRTRCHRLATRPVIRSSTTRPATPTTAPSRRIADLCEPVRENATRRGGIRTHTPVTREGILSPQGNSANADYIESSDDTSSAPTSRADSRNDLGLQRVLLGDVAGRASRGHPSHDRRGSQGRIGISHAYPPVAYGVGGSVRRRRKETRGRSVGSRQQTRPVTAA